MNEGIRYPDFAGLKNGHRNDGTHTEIYFSLSKEKTLTGYLQSELFIIG